MAAPKYSEHEIAAIREDLRRAITALAEGEWYNANTFKLDDDWRRLDLWEPEERLDALRRAASEVSIDVYSPTPPPNRAAEVVCKGAIMRPFVWDSPSFRQRMYFKFAIHGGYLFIFSIHPADF